MDFVQILAGAIVLGSTLGTTVASVFAYRQKSLVTMLRESNSDYKLRVEQLEDERESLKKIIETLQADVGQLKREKTLPLDNLTKLVESNILQSRQTDKSILELTKVLRQQGKKNAK